MEERQRITAQFRDFTYKSVPIKDYSLDENLPTQPNCYVCTSSPKVGLGSLDTLPLEILHNILPQLDLLTLTDFRRVNQRALQLVASLPQFKAINSHARDALRGILSIETGRWITCEDLYATLCTAQCERCGDFGAYLYILTCKRVCFLCFTQAEAYLPLRFIHATQKFGLDRSILNTLPRMRSIPGKYANNPKKCRERLTLVDPESARRAGIALHGSVAAMEDHAWDIAGQKMLRYEVRLAQLSAGLSGSSTTRRPRIEGPFDRESDNPLRFMAIVHMPWLNRTTQDIELGSFCVGCEGSYNAHRNKPMYFRRRFNVDSFNAHLKECGSIKDRKHCPNRHENTIAQ